MSKQEIVKALKEIRENEVYSQYIDALDFAIDMIEKKYLNKKCRDCKWLNGKKICIGIECTNPDKEWRTDTAIWHQPSTPACKMFKEKEKK